MRDSVVIREEMYRHKGRWRYANKFGDPEACESLQGFLCRATPDDDATLEMRVINLDDEPCLESVRCNGMESNDSDLLDDLMALFSDQFSDALFAWP